MVDGWGNYSTLGWLIDWLLDEETYILWLIDWWGNSSTFGWLIDLLIDEETDLPWVNWLIEEETDLQLIDWLIYWCIFLFDWSVDCVPLMKARGGGSAVFISSIGGESIQSKTLKNIVY